MLFINKEIRELSIFFDYIVKFNAILCENSSSCNTCECKSVINAILHCTLCIVVVAKDPISIAICFKLNTI